MATDALAEHRQEINALNVFPVPDGDTGTNLYLTIAAARDGLTSSAAELGGDEGQDKGRDEGRDEDAAGAMAAFARGALLGARGNSGAILAEMIGALVRRLATAPPEEPRAAGFAAGLRAASVAAVAAVGEPLEGTMLTVLCAAAEAAERSVSIDPAVHTRDVIGVAAAAAREALEHTPEQLDVLRVAGVVDAGGRGVCVILDAFDAAVSGRLPAAPSRPARSAEPVAPSRPPADAATS
ncbi:DAK2 domain-containing protein, partial [Nocardioides sp.]|uniref:DAK2 domain-containing protein n=1 Tax=Nocardioides sp. TaxID=35761 RepID=UPI0039E6695D